MRCGRTCRITRLRSRRSSIEGDRDAAVRVAEPADVLNADRLGGGLLLRPPDARDVGAGDRLVEAACIPVGDDAVRHLDAGLGEGGDGACGPEIHVVGMRGYDEDALHAGSPVPGPGRRC